MIVKDEELALPRVLEVAPVFANETIIVDTGSTDKTAEIAAAAGCKVYSYEWRDDFASARNYAFKQATGDYVMWLDADDVITPSRARKIARLKNSLSADAVMLPYHIGDPPSLVFWRERILKRQMGFEFKGRVHEAIEISGNIIYENIPIVHDKLKRSDPERNLKIFEKMLDEQKDFSGREAFYFGSELYYNGKFDSARIWLKKFLGDTGTGSDKGQASLFLSNMATTAEDKRDSLKTGLTFSFAPDLLCRLGDIYMSESNYKVARSCFLTALVADERITFSSPDMQGYYPHIRLCSCYWHLNDKKRSKYHNDMALTFKPNDKYALYNSALFE